MKKTLTLLLSLLLLTAIGISKTNIIEAEEDAIKISHNEHGTVEYIGESSETYKSNEYLYYDLKIIPEDGYNFIISYDNDESKNNYIGEYGNYKVWKNETTFSLIYRPFTTDNMYYINHTNRNITKINIRFVRPIHHLFEMYLDDYSKKFFEDGVTNHPGIGYDPNALFQDYDARYSLLTDDEKQKLESGSEVVMYVEMKKSTDSNENNILASQKQNDEIILGFLDISMYVKVDNGEPRKVTSSIYSEDLLFTPTKETVSTESNKERKLLLTKNINLKREVAAEDICSLFGTYSVSYDKFLSTTNTIYMLSYIDYIGEIRVTGRGITTKGSYYDENEKLIGDIEITLKAYDKEENNSLFLEYDDIVELEGASIYYTLDGSTPTKESTKYTGPILLKGEDEEKTCILKAIAIKDYYKESNVIEFETKFGATNSTISMHRLYNPNSGEHFYTKDVGEKDSLVSLGWKYEGVGWIAPKESNYPVYRLYNANGGEHHYTMNQDEKDMLVSLGWKDEGIGWYSADPNDTNSKPLHREYNPNAFANNHNYTLSDEEHDMLITAGWKDEGNAWFAVSD